jgi:hypothetical protein
VPTLKTTSTRPVRNPQREQDSHTGQLHLLSKKDQSPNNSAHRKRCVSRRDESQWTDTLRMHEVIAAAVDPTTALSVGLKLDAEALPPAVVQGIQNATTGLKSPATTASRNNFRVKRACDPGGNAARLAVI